MKEKGTKLIRVSDAMHERVKGCAVKDKISMKEWAERAFKIYFLSRPLKFGFKPPTK
jgi:predicted HicB family RNase H-like nuclease